MNSGTVVLEMAEETSVANQQLSSTTMNRANDSHLMNILRTQNISQQNVILNYRRELQDIREFSAAEKTVLEGQINELNQRLEELESRVKEADENVSSIHIRQMPCIDKFFHVALI